MPTIVSTGQLPVLPNNEGIGHIPSMSVLETLSWSQAAHFAFWWYNNVEN